MIPELVLVKINKGCALKFRDAEYYPKRYDDKVPLRIRMLETVCSDLPHFMLMMGVHAATLEIEDNDSPILDSPILVVGNEYYCSVNSYGAVTAITDDGRMLGVKPNEFEVIEFHK